MARRNLLHVSKLDVFAAWAATQGYVREDPKGDYEVLRLRRAGKPPVLFYRKLDAVEHVTAQDDGETLVHRWLRQR